MDLILGVLVFTHRVEVEFDTEARSLGHLDVPVLDLQGIHEQVVDPLDVVGLEQFRIREFGIEVQKWE